MHKHIAIAAIDQDFVEGTAPAGIKLSILKADGTDAVPATVMANEPFSFDTPDDLPVGTYSVVAQAVDVAGAPLGSPVTTTFAVTVVSVKVPQSITVTSV